MRITARVAHWATALAVMFALSACHARAKAVTTPSLPASLPAASGAPPTSVTTPPDNPTRPLPSPTRTEPPVTMVPPRVVVSDVAPSLAREFRGVWVATVANIDWPSSRTLSTAQQKQELLTLLDRVVALNLNAVIFQVRPAADALYASSVEPWSEYLTGKQGRAPDPYWDPLEFAVREAHARNLELHAWFNPYRARQAGAKSPLARSHIARTNPALVKPYGEMLWMDPGEKAVRDRTIRVVLDVVKRYDIDGVHIDDYFYPYPEAKRGKEIPFPDNGSYKRYVAKGGKLDRDDWRRNNVNELVHLLNDGVHKEKPWVKFGVSPFGIWRPGSPAQIRGFDSYEKLYADARKWLNEGWIDYFTPQLYWPTFKAEQSYPVLLEWWAHENTFARHLWPGNFTSRAAGAGSSAFPVSELVEQLRVTREQPGATGNVHFSMKAFLTNQGGMNDTLVGGPYASTALVPATPWLHASAPPIPALRATDRRGITTVALGTTRKGTPWQWVVQVRTDTGWTITVLPGTTATYQIPSGLRATDVSVRSINRVGVESPSIAIPLAVGAASSTRTDATQAISLRGRVGGR